MSSYENITYFPCLYIMKLTMKDNTSLSFNLTFVPKIVEYNNNLGICPGQRIKIHFIL